MNDALMMTSDGMESYKLQITARLALIPTHLVPGGFGLRLKAVVLVLGI
jgi:hypothetical protein